MKYFDREIMSNDLSIMCVFFLIRIKILSYYWLQSNLDLREWLISLFLSNNKKIFYREMMCNDLTKMCFKIKI